MGIIGGGGGGGGGVGLTGPNSSGALVMVAGDDTDCTDADTWYVTQGTFIGVGLQDCTVSSAGLFTYTGAVAKKFLISGVFSVIVDKACTLMFGSRINGVDQPGGVPRVFPAQSPNGDAVQFGIAELNPGDNFLAIMQSDTANTTVSTVTSFGTFWSEYV
ncbi:MAG: hypothetical protein GY841_13355 [FCB group bacterium]|nr:hypothetical protein [FCB group bacterium]